MSASLPITPSIEIIARGFRKPFTHLNSSWKPKLTKKRCLKFAITVGNSHFSRSFARTQTALAMAAYRASAVRCVLDFDSANIKLRDEYPRLEATEKVNLSYWIGMIFAAFAADQILDVPRLTHATRKDGVRKVNQKSKSLADLVGQDSSGRWHVIEAKARQKLPGPYDLLEWKAQATSIASINGTRVSTSCYSLARLLDPCSITLEDPPSNGSAELQISPSRLNLDYYSPFVEFLGLRPSKLVIDKRVLLVKPIGYDPVDKEYIFIGLEDKHYLAMTNNKDTPRFVEEFENEQVFIAKDGVCIVMNSDPCKLQ